MHKNLVAVAVSAIALTVIPGVTFSSASAAPAKKFSNCAALNKAYPHGVGLPRAHDKTSGVPVTNFTRNKKVYLQNKGRDRDKDGIACEKR